MRSERALALGFAAIGYPLGWIAGLPWIEIGVFTLALAGLWWLDELAWATTWPLRWWHGLTREEIEEDRNA